jgi:ATPase subunit of ABC transporter with duplicated ATPase domains
MHLSLAHVSFAHADAVPILIDATQVLEPGWHGIVGANGAGKTTLLRLLAGELEPSAGVVRRMPAGLAVARCPQTADRLEDQVTAFAESRDGLAAGLRGRLRLDPADLDRWATLSPGERTRWQIGAALAAGPAILLLDEPTNHLDGEARALLVRALARFDGIGVVVSHDRALLNALTTRTLRLERGVLGAWRGGYDAARALWEAEERRRQADHRAVRDRERRLEHRLADRRERRAQAAAEMRTSKRMKGRRDSATRAAFKATRRRSAETALAREVTLVGRQLERTREIAAAFHVERRLGRDLVVSHARAPAPWLLRLDLPALRAGSRVLLRDLHLGLGRDDRIRLHGPNGAGKSTLLRAMLAASPSSDRLLYLPQELSGEAEDSLLHALRGLGPAERGLALTTLAGLGVDPGRLLASASPSPGEARKVCLALGLAREVPGIVLDEPTNHLDLPSIERLEDSLAAYPGAVLLVTHDDALARRVVRTRWAIVDGRVEVASEPGTPGEVTGP